jgi:hypothetical protein
MVDSWTYISANQVPISTHEGMGICHDQHIRGLCVAYAILETHWPMVRGNTQTFNPHIARQLNIWDCDVRVAAP